MFIIFCLGSFSGFRRYTQLEFSYISFSFPSSVSRVDFTRACQSISSARLREMPAYKSRRLEGAGGVCLYRVIFVFLLFFFPPRSSDERKWNRFLVFLSVFFFLSLHGRCLKTDPFVYSGRTGHRRHTTRAFDQMFRLAGEKCLWNVSPNHGGEKKNKPR